MGVSCDVVIAIVVLLRVVDNYGCYEHYDCSYYLASAVDNGIVVIGEMVVGVVMDYLMMMLCCCFFLAWLGS